MNLFFIFLVNVSQKYAKVHTNIAEYIYSR